MSTPAPPLLTSKDIARYFQVSVRTIRRWHQGGQLPPPVRIGGSLRWRADDLQAWFIERCSGNGNSTASLREG